MAKDVAVKAPAGALAQFSQEKPEFMKDTHRGSENVTMQDMVIPRLSIIQSLSPQRMRQNAEYIQGAEEGMIFNTVTRKLYTPPIVIVPCFFRKEVVLWKKRQAGGGFKGAFKTMEEAVAVKNSMPDKMTQDKDGKPVEAYEALDTAHQFVMILEGDGSVSEAVLSLVKTGLTFSRKFNSLIELGGGDRFSRAYKLATDLRTDNPKGDFFAWKIEPVGFVNENLYKKAEQLYKAVSGGIKDVAYEAGGSDEISM